MHELGVTFHVLDLVEEIAKENEMTQVEAVNLRLGEVSTVIESYLQNCWKWAVKKRPPVLQNAKLVVEIIPAVTFCEDCRQEYGTVAHGKICPHCGSGHTYLLRGSEFMIQEIEGY